MHLLTQEHPFLFFSLVCLWKGEPPTYLHLLTVSRHEGGQKLTTSHVTSCGCYDVECEDSITAFSQI